MDWDKAMVAGLAQDQGVCVRPLARRLVDRVSGEASTVVLPCGSTRESRCPPCAKRARVLRMHQCAEGWHRIDELPEVDLEPDDGTDDGTDEADDADGDDELDGRVVRGLGVPVDPARYDYRPALDAMHVAKLVDRWVQNLRRGAGFKVQYFAAIEPQRRLAPHVHVAMRGAIERKVIRAVTKGTYFQLWWPSFDVPLYVHRSPVFIDGAYRDPDTHHALKTWQDALADLDQDPDTRPGACDAPGSPGGRQGDPGRDQGRRPHDRVPDQVPDQVHVRPDGRPPTVRQRGREAS